MEIQLFEIDKKLYVFRNEDEELIITNGVDVWNSVEFIYSKLVKDSKKLLKKALEKQDSETYKYTLKDNELIVGLFTRERKGALELATIKLQKSKDKSEIIIMFASVIEQRNKLFEERNKFKRFADERDDAIRISKEALDSRDLLEKELYSHFIHILNEKKDKIIKLKSQLEKMKENKSPKKSSPKPNKKKEKEPLYDEQGRIREEGLIDLLED